MNITGKPKAPWLPIDRSVPPDLADVASPWGIFYSPAGSYLGRLVHTMQAGTMVLAPAYHYLAQTTVQQGSAARPKFILPLEMLVSAETIELPPCPVVWVGSWDDADRDDLLKGIAAAESLRAKLAAARSGITLAPAGTKLPPMPRRG